MPTWNPDQYLKFQRERTQPAIDLANALPKDGEPLADGTPVRRVLDVGSGPGNSTAILRNRYPHADILGIDSSPDMVTRARADHPDCRFALADVSDPASLASLGGPFDVVFSNACIQWVPDHPHLVPRLLGLLTQGGTLAIQTPMNYEEPIHKIIGEVARLPRFAARLADARIFHNLTPPEYWELLHAHAASSRLWMTSYLHTLPGHDAIMEWYRGTGMRPYLQALDAEDATAFEAEVLARVQEAYPTQSDGSVIFPFPRFFFVATR